jgi:Sulfotransferase domain
VSKRNEELARKRSWLRRIYSPSFNDDAKAPRPKGSVIRLPDFFIIGPPRTGTTWLYEILRDRTALPSPTKETRFFDTHFHRGVEWYRAHFPSARTFCKVGEVAPTYFACSEAAERIASLIPLAKIVCVFRNPVERVLSLYKLKCAYGLIPWTFDQAIVRDPEMIESSRYATRLKVWQQVVGKEKILSAFYEDLRENPQSFLDTIVDFIEVPRFSLTSAQTQGIHTSEIMTHPRSYQRTRSASTMADWFKARRLDAVVAAVRNSPLRKLFLGGGQPFAELPSETILKLYELFRPEVEELEHMLNRDLSSWKSMENYSFARQRLRNKPLILRSGADAM